MIEWIVWEENVDLEHDKEYLVTDGKRVDVATFFHFDNERPEWSLPDLSNIDGSVSITHFAKINLP